MYENINSTCSPGSKSQYIVDNSVSKTTFVESITIPCQDYQAHQLKQCEDHSLLQGKGTSGNKFHITSHT